MLMLANSIKLATASGCLLWVFLILRHQRFSALETSWAVFCSSMAFVLFEEIFAGALGRYSLLLGMAGGATCSVFWLFTRALFRPDAGIRWPHLLLVSGVILPSVINRGMRFFEANNWIGTANQDVVIQTLGNFQLLLCSTALLLSFAEAGRGFARISGPERHLRLAFLGTFGVCVTVCMVLPIRETLSSSAEALAQSICAITIFIVASIAVKFRREHPLTKTAERLQTRRMEATSSDTALGRRIEALFKREEIHLDAELKVGDLARRLMEPEYKISRAITAGLGLANFNRLVNHYRVQHARALLANTHNNDMPVLDIALASGFASLGPFNRAFKEATGLTPRQYRLDHALTSVNTAISSAE